MSDFLNKAKEQARQGIGQGREKVEELQAQRAGNDLLRKLGAAYYAEKHGLGTEQATQNALGAVETHVSAHGDNFLRS
jgi:hypothetical protein